MRDCRQTITLVKTTINNPSVITINRCYKTFPKGWFIVVSTTLVNILFSRFLVFQMSHNPGVHVLQTLSVELDLAGETWGWALRTCLGKPFRPCTENSKSTIFEGSFEVKLPTIWTDGKNRGGKSQRGEAKKWEEQRREIVRRKKMQVREKVRKSRFTVFFQWFAAQEGRKVGSLKRRVWSHLARWEIKNCTSLWPEAHFQAKMHKTPHSDDFWKFRRRKSAHHCVWREAHFQVKMHKAHHSRTTFGSGDVEKAHAVVARSTFPSQNGKSTTCSDHFWKWRCRQSARRCGPKHIWKWNVSKNRGFEPFLTLRCRKSHWLT